MHSALRLNLFHLKCTDRELTLTRRLWMGFALMALLTLTVPWWDGTTCALSARWKKTTPGIDSYHEYGAPVERSQRLGLFAAQNLTSADNEKMWQAQGECSPHKA